jgi:hypothetical protein
MALTSEDLHNIKHLFDDRFDQLDGRLDQYDRQLAAIRGDIENLAIATAQQFAVIDERFDSVDEDLADVKSVVADHGYRLTRVERHAA